MPIPTHPPSSPITSKATTLDAQDPLGQFRRKFHLPVHANGQDVAYFVGNSLGLQPRTATRYVKEVLDDWARYGVEGHFKAKHAWMPYHGFVADAMARVVGASPIEVVVMNTLTVNLHLMMVSFYQPTSTRNKVLMEAQAFPSDQYAIASQVRFHGHDPQTAIVEVAPRDGEDAIRTEDWLRTIEEVGDELALVLIGGVNYFTGQWFDMQAITEAAHRKGITVGFDLAHAAGNVPVQLHDWDVDFAVWCTYKYLNGGPGNLSGCFVHERHAHRTDLPRFAGWWGHDQASRFAMPNTFQPMPGAEGWQLSNPPILPLAALRASLALFDKAGMQALRQKSERLTEYFADRLTKAFTRGEVQIITPADPAQRGCQLSLRIPERGRAVYETLNKQGVLCDWREPNAIRAAPVPLYNSFADVDRFVHVLEQVLHSDV